MPGDQEDITRYLCAAAHLDDRFADDVVREFLTAPARPVPPAPGVRAGRVLAEVVAARSRRGVRDAVLLVLFCCVAVTLSVDTLVAWLIVGLAVGACVGFTTRHWPVTTSRLLAAIGIGFTGGMVLAALVWHGTPAIHMSPELVLTAGLLAVSQAVLAADELVVWHHVDYRFRRGRVLPDPGVNDVSPQARPVFRFAPATVLDHLRRHLQAPEEWHAAARDTSDEQSAPLIAVRGRRVSAGAGEPHEPWTLVVPLTRRSGAERVAELTTRVLYEHVDRAMDTVAAAVYPPCGERFAGLRVTEQVVVLAEQARGLAIVFTDSPAAPYPLLRGQRVRAIRDTPLRWARYYRRFQVETQDRDVMVSAFLHMSVSETALYVEWTPCVLPPVRERYRVVDTPFSSPLLPVVRAVARFLALPASVPARLRTLWPVRRSTWRVPAAERYGVATGLRELAADTEVRDPFHAADRDRYLKLLESRLMLALVDGLSDAGYSVGPLAQKVAASRGDPVDRVHRRTAGRVGSRLVGAE